MLCDSSVSYSVEQEKTVSLCESGEGGGEKGVFEKDPVKNPKKKREVKTPAIKKEKPVKNSEKTTKKQKKEKTGKMGQIEKNGEIWRKMERNWVKWGKMNNKRQNKKI